MHVCVVGGGIVGLASAHYLAERGAAVTLFERGSLGGGSTGRAVGGIRAQFSTPANVAMSLASIPVWESFEARFGVDIGYRRPGYLFLAREERTAADLREAAAMQADLGVPVDLLDPAEATDHCPELHADRYAAASYAPTDGFADPHLALQGFSAAAREGGVAVRTGTPVTDLAVEGGRVAGVETPDGTHDADAVVNAAGPWAARVAAMAGVDVPVEPGRRQVAVVDPETPVGEDVPLTIDLDSGSYFRPEREGRALVGGHFADGDANANVDTGDDADTADDADPDRHTADPTAPAAVDPDAYDEGMDLDWAVTAVERAGETAGYFGPETRVRRGWAGLYAITPDHSAVIEESLPGFVQAVGFSGHGFQHSPATGQVVADLCLDGATDVVDLDPFRLDRFGADDRDGTGDDRDDHEDRDGGERHVA